jgi:uncharacterized protein (TIGR00269 family)
VSVEERFRREIARQLPRFARGTVAVALSGGKDSSLALFLAHRYFRERPNVRLFALSVDEGIRGYRAPALARAAELTRSLGLTHRIVRAAEELGTTTDERVADGPGMPPCSFCGVWRRTLLNRSARAEGADALLLGFNLDDLAQTVLMNLVQGDLDRLLRMAPHTTRAPGLVPRIAPLAQVPEREVYLAAVAAGLPFDHAECPHAARASRNRFRTIVWDLEEAQPGTRQALLRTQRRLADALREGGPSGIPGSCQACGEPASGPFCRGCELLGNHHPPASGREAT